MADFNFQQTTAQLQAAIIAASRVATSSVDGLMSHTDKNDLTNAKKDIENLQTQVNGLQAIAYVESIYAYGAEFDVTISSRNLTRIGNMDYHRSLPIQNRMRGCLLDDDGNVVEYLDPQDWTNHDRSGARGQVMVEIPKHYERFITDGNKRRVMLSELDLPGYIEVPKMYVSAYEAALDRTNNKLASVVNTTAQYRGGNNSTDYDSDVDGGLLGRPVTNISLTNFRAYARNRKSGSTEWNCMTALANKTIYWLFVVEYATFDSQKAYNASLTTDGYHQGGLGDGVTNISSSAWGSWRAYNPFVPCGYTDELGNRTGVKSYTTPPNYNSGSSITMYVPRYRGIENPFGHIWKWVDGYLIMVEPSTGDNVSRVYRTYDPSKFSSSSVANYAHVGNEARSEGYGKEHIFGETGEIIAKSVGASSTTYLCDYHYQNSDVSSAALRGVRFGGTANNGASAGFAFSYSINAPSASDARIGSRLCFHYKPR